MSLSSLYFLVIVITAKEAPFIEEIDMAHKYKHKLGYLYIRALSLCQFTTHLEPFNISLFF